ncbi:MAG: hypothetical protein AAF907_02905, partial [Planctomycetota bacterium]
MRIDRFVIVPPVSPAADPASPSGEETAAPLAQSAISDGGAGVKRTLVVKVGTNVLTGADGRPKRERIASLSAQIARVRTPERAVVLVSSGAVGAGLDLLRLDRRP